MRINAAALQRAIRQRLELLHEPYERQAALLAQGAAQGRWTTRRARSRARGPCHALCHHALRRRGHVRRGGMSPSPLLDVACANARFLHRASWRRTQTRHTKTPSTSWRPRPIRSSLRSWCRGDGPRDCRPTHHPSAGKRAQARHGAAVDRLRLLGAAEGADEGPRGALIRSASGSLCTGAAAAVFEPVLCALREPQRQQEAQHLRGDGGLRPAAVGSALRRWRALIGRPAAAVVCWRRYAFSSSATRHGWSRDAPRRCRARHHTGSAQRRLGYDKIMSHYAATMQAAGVSTDFQSDVVEGA
jgi:hypothetical protein